MRTEQELRDKLFEITNKLKLVSMKKENEKYWGLLYTLDALWWIYAMPFNEWR